MNRRGFLQACLTTAIAPYVVTSVGILMPARRLITDPWTLSEDNLEQMLIEISQLTDDRGLRIQLIPRSLIVPFGVMPDRNEIYKDCKRILSSKRRCLVADGWTTDER